MADVIKKQPTWIRALSAFGARPAQLALAAALLAVAGFSCWCLVAAHGLIDAQKGAAAHTIHQEGDETREWLRLNLIPIARQAEADANARTAQLARSADDFLRAMSGAVFQVTGPRGQLAGLRSDVMDMAAMLSGQLGGGVQVIEDLRTSLEPAVRNLNAASAELPPAVRDARFLLARSARTMGQVEQASNRIGAAIPQFVSIAAATGLKLQATADESAATAQQTRVFMTHLAEATKPLPWPVRIGLAVGPPLVQTGFTVASFAALGGKSK